MKNGLSGVRTGLAAALAFGLCHATFAATELTVYTAVEAEDLKKYAARFNEDHPDIKINWVRDSTGIVTAKLLALFQFHHNYFYMQQYFFQYHQLNIEKLLIILFLYISLPQVDLHQ